MCGWPYGSVPTSSQDTTRQSEENTWNHLTAGTVVYQDAGLRKPFIIHTMFSQVTLSWDFVLFLRVPCVSVFVLRRLTRF